MSLTDELKDLQWKQLKHDENYHKDIWLLTVHQRLNHMILHFAKYGGQLALANHEQDVGLFSKTCLDAIIIATSSANILNLNLSEVVISTNIRSSTLNELPVELANISRATMPAIQTDFTIAVGRLAKAAESIDHLEKFPYRETLSEHIVQLFRIAMAGFAICNDRKLLSAVQERMLVVERKSMFFERLGNYKDGY
jgi:hypothetical protein